MSDSNFGDYTQFDLIGEHTEWIYMIAPVQEEPDKKCEGAEKCPTTNPFKSELVVNLAGSKWYFFNEIHIPVVILQI